jgi:hypothetical protein
LPCAGRHRLSLAHDGFQCRERRTKTVFGYRAGIRPRPRGDVRAAEERWRRIPPAESLTPAIPPSPGADASPREAQPAVDGADPDQAACSADAVTVSARRIALADRHHRVDVAVKAVLEATAAA